MNTPSTSRRAPVLLGDVLSPDALTKAVTRKWITTREWNGATIYNYTRATQYKEHWTHETRTCRGLIVDTDNRVLARPFPKFFNISEPCAEPLPPPGTPFTVTDKWDGFLGIGYRHPDGQWRISTRGSMTSPQAREATAIWNDKYSHFAFPPGVTPLFEIVYPQQRIVVDYGNLRDLVLLAALDIATGADVPLADLGWPGPTAQTRNFHSVEELTDHMNRTRPDEDPEEGFVITFDLGPHTPSLRYKTKRIKYVELHRAIFGLTRRMVWRELAAKDSHRRGVPFKRMTARLRMEPRVAEVIIHPDYDLRASIPEEIHKWYDTTSADLRSRYDDRVSLYEQLLRCALRESPDPYPSKAFALTVSQLSRETGTDRGVLLAMAKGKTDAYASIWRDIEPVGEQGVANCV